MCIHIRSSVVYFSVCTKISVLYLRGLKKQHLIWIKQLSLFESTEVWCWSMTPKQTNTITNVGQQTGQVKAEDRLSLDGVGQHSLSSVYLTVQLVSCLSSLSMGSVCTITPLCLCLYQAKWITFLPFQPTVYKEMWYKKGMVLVIHLQGVHPPPLPPPSAQSWMLEPSPSQALR